MSLQVGNWWVLIKLGTSKPRWTKWRYLFSCVQSSLKKTTPLDVAAILIVTPAEFLDEWYVAPYISRLSTVCISRYSAADLDTPVNMVSWAVMREASSKSVCHAEPTGSQSVYDSSCSDSRWKSHDAASFQPTTHNYCSYMHNKENLKIKIKQTKIAIFQLNLSMITHFHSISSYRYLLILFVHFFQGKTDVQEDASTIWVYRQDGTGVAKPRAVKKWRRDVSHSNTATETHSSTCLVLSL